MFHKLSIFTLLVIAMPLAAQWAPTAGLFGGEVRMIAVSGNTIFVTLGYGNIYRSTNNGNSWLKANNGVGNGGNLLSVSSSDVFSADGASVLKWRSDSLKWSKISTVHYGADIEFFTGLKEYLFCATISAYERSSDAGLTWKVINGKVNCLCTVDSLLYVGTDHGIECTSDYGDHWQLVDSSLKGIKALAANGTTLFAVTESLYASTDSGRKWINITPITFTGTTINAIEVLGKSVFVGNEQGLFVTSDEGYSWVYVTDGLPSIPVLSLATSGQVLFAGSGGLGVFRSLDRGVHWESASFGLEPIGVSQFTTLDQTLYGVSSHVWRSSDSGMHWKCPESSMNSTFSMENNNIRVTTSLGPYVFAGTSKLYRSSDEGATWQVLSLPITNNDDIIQALLVHNDRIFVATKDYGLFTSLDSGAHWNSANNGLPTNSNIVSLSASKDNILLGTNNPQNTQSGVFLSNDSGNSWYLISGDIIPLPNKVLAIDTFFFAAPTYWNFVYRSSPNDTTWTLIPKWFAHNVTALTNADTLLIVGSDTGVFISFDYGEHWRDLDSGLLSKEVSSLGVADNYLFATVSPEYINPQISTWRIPLSAIPSSPYILHASADSIGFGDTPLGADSICTVKITNIGRATETVKPFQVLPINNDFSTSDVSSPIQLNPGESFTFVVFYHPKTSGFHTAKLELTSEAKKVVIYLSGNAYSLSTVGVPSLCHFALSTHPNPLSQSTTISLTPETSAHAEISILNLLGTEVTHLFSGELSPGDHTFQWNPNPSLPDGMYECLIRMNGGAPQRLPMMLVR